ncbi:hypothetical protein DFH11DRAFT_330119 [Phellopilus nigrolimitatus]|nr:hypothetical protein DFH11DRAFT_330119 [Phellopilus nigrolimitatus]
MRSLASTLSIGRGGKSENGSALSAHSAPVNAPRLAKSRSATLFAKAPKTLVETNSVTHSRPTLALGSSSSSDGSSSLRTPEDEGVVAFPKTDEKKRWSSWFGWRRSPDIVVDEPGDIGHTSSNATLARGNTRDDEHITSARVARHSIFDTDDDDDSDSESSDYHEGPAAIARRPAHTHTSIVKAQSNLRTLLRNNLMPSPSPPPLVVMPSSAQFPVSSTNHRNAHYEHTFESTLHLHRMLRRLEQQNLTHAELASIASLGSRPQPKVATRNRQDKTDDEMISDASMRVGQFSRGLRKWASRPCFEQRFLVWQPDETGKVARKNVMGVGRGLAVCDLEFSEGLEALAGLFLDDQAFEMVIFPPPPTAKGPILKPMPRKPSPPRGSPRRTSFQSSPSPLRLEQGLPATAILSPVSPLSSVASSAPTSPIIVTRASEPSIRVSSSSALSSERGVRFADDVRDAEDDIPLGYAIQAKKKREEKERFLRAEREKRDRQNRAEERRQVEAERVRTENERRRVEEEKRVREERQKAKFAEEVAAARHRRELARAGMENVMSIREAGQRVQGPLHSRAAYDMAVTSTTSSRRRASDYTSPSNGFPFNGSSNVSSAVGSSEDKRRSSAMPSNASAFQGSAEDLRPPVSRRQSVVSENLHQHPPRPMSVASSSSQRLSLPRTQSAPVQVPTMLYPMMPPIPPVPPIPVWGMPLLAPNAPFMMQQYSRSPSPGMNPNSRDSSSSRRQSFMQPIPPVPSSSRSQHPSNSRSRLSPFPSGGNTASKPAVPPINGSDNPHRQSRSASYSPQLPSSSKPLPRDERPRRSQYGSTMSLVPPNAQRRTTMM